MSRNSLLNISFPSMMPYSRLLLLLTAFAAMFLHSDVVNAGHRFLIQGRGKLAIVDEQGKIEWEMPWGAIHDLHVLKDGHIMVQQGAAKVAEINERRQAPERAKMIVNRLL